MLEDKTKRTPIIGPLVRLAQSRRVMLSIIELLVLLTVFQWPALEAVQNEFAMVSLIMWLALVGGLSIEDAIAAGRKVNVPDTLDKALSDTIRDTITELADGKTEQTETNNAA